MKKKGRGRIEALGSWKPGVAGAPAGSVQVIDMFSGCGGMSLGFAASGLKNATYRLIGAVDLNQHSLNTYETNFGVPAVNMDIRDLAASPRLLQELLEKFDRFDPTSPVVLIGCAPCQGFSAHRKKEWDREDGRNSLIEAFATVAAAISPDCIVMENVPELLSGRYWSYFESFRELLTEHGYTIKQAIHNAAEYGVPQERFRALVIAMKQPLFGMPRSIVPRSEFLTVRDAIGDLSVVGAGESVAGDPFHRSAKHRQSTIDVIKAIPLDGGSRPFGVGPACLDRVKGFYDVYGRLAWDKPSITITHYARNPASGRFVHPDQHRGLTMREAARLQGFPDSFTFTGKFDDVFRQIGEAVPPPLSLAIANSITSSLRGDFDAGVEEFIVDSPIKDSFAGVIAGIKARG